MTRRDIFAAIAMHALIRRDEYKDHSACALEAYNIAAAMLNEREGRPGVDSAHDITDGLERAITNAGREVSDSIDSLTASFDAAHDLTTGGE